MPTRSGAPSAERATVRVRARLTKRLNKKRIVRSLGCLAPPPSPGAGKRSNQETEKLRTLDESFLGPPSLIPRNVMKSKLLLLALAFTPALAPLTARAEEEVSFEFFYDNLSPYGE